MIQTVAIRALRSVLGGVLASALLLGCIPEKTAEQVELAPFFDLKGYIDTEVERLATEVPRADKQITFNGQTESHDTMALDYADELAIFRNSDINRPAWLEKYTVDSIRASGQLTVDYLALDTSLAVRKLRVVEAAESVVRIEIDRQTGTVLSDGRQHLRYEPAVGYLIDSYQDRRFGESLDTRIEVRFAQ
jgi:hypothetical protein